MNSLSEQVKDVIGLAPLTDRFAGTVRTDVISIKGYDVIDFLVIVGANSGGAGTGNSTITLSACPDFTPSSRTAMAFRYRVGTDTETLGAWTAATSSGFVTTAGGTNRCYLIQVTSGEAVAALSTAVAVELTAVEATNDPMEGCIMVRAYKALHQGATMRTAIA